MIKGKIKAQSPLIWLQEQRFLYEFNGGMQITFIAILLAQALVNQRTQIPVPITLFFQPYCMVEVCQCLLIAIQVIEAYSTIYDRPRILLINLQRSIQI